MLIAQLTDGYVGDEGGGGERAGGAARQLGEVAVGHEVLEGGGDADVVDPQEPAPGEALSTAARARSRVRFRSRTLQVPFRLSYVFKVCCIGIAV